MPTTLVSAALVGPPCCRSYHTASAAAPLLDTQLSALLPKPRDSHLCNPICGTFHIYRTGSLCLPTEMLDEAEPKEEDKWGDLGLEQLAEL